MTGKNDLINISEDINRSFVFVMGVLYLLHF